jgi:hypothetical protein
MKRYRGKESKFVRHFTQGAPIKAHHPIGGYLKSKPKLTYESIEKNQAV